jgi:predicted amino acid-binding ACT domain protein
VRTRKPAAAKGGREYYPRRIALVAPQGESVFEFVVTGEDRPGMVHAISGVFGKHYVNLASVDSDTIASGDFVLVTYADFRKADASAGQVQKEIRSLQFVKSVVFGSATNVLFERYLFPITVGGSNRAIILPVGALIEYEKAVLQRAGAEVGAQHLIATGRPVGLGLASTLRSYMPWAAPDALVVAATDAMRALGWGLCTFDRSKIKEGTVSVTVQNPMFAGLAETSVSWLLVGVIGGILQDVLEFPNALDGDVSSIGNSELRFGLARSKEAKPAKPAASKRSAKR